MDDATRKTTPEHETGAMIPIESTNTSTTNQIDQAARTRPAEQPEPGLTRGASMTEFTQMAHRYEEPKIYAMPEPEPFDATVEGIPVRRDHTPVSYSTQPMQPALVHGGYPPQTPTQTPQPVYPALQTQPKPVAQKQNWMWVIIAVVLFATSVAFSIGAFLVLRLTLNNNTLAVVDNTGSGEGGVAGDGTFIPPTLMGGENGDQTTATAAPTATLGLAIQPWDGKRRLTILMLGIDKRPNDKGTAFRTDSIMLVSIDPETKSVGILSVPRDLFVDIPTDTVITTPYGLQRVNSAYVIGELARPGYGPQLAMQTMQYNLGIRINNYVVYEFTSVINAIDMIGGVDINVPYAIYDATYPNMYYGYEPLRIPQGLIHMNGDLALKYGRTRHQTNDFDRAKRQQQVVMAIREKIINDNMLPELLLKAPQLWDQLSKTTRTDLDFAQMLQLAVYLKDIPKDKIKQGVIDPNYVTGLNYRGQDILLPERALLGPLFKEIFGPNYSS